MNTRFAIPGSEFGPFLYSLVGEERNGMLLSVLSALARRNLDPWHEAAELAALPVEIARKRLASLVEGLPGVTAREEAGKTVDRLMVLLPKRVSPEANKSTTASGGRELTKSFLIMAMIVVGLMWGAQAISAIRPPSITSAQSTATTVSEASEPKTSLDSGQ